MKKFLTNAQIKLREIAYLLFPWGHAEDIAFTNQLEFE